MMTQLEQRALSLLASACSKYINDDKPENINWEQRKYETAKDYATALMESQWYEGTPQDAIVRGIAFAEELITRLKNN